MGKRQRPVKNMNPIKRQIQIRDKYYRLQSKASSYSAHYLSLYDAYKKRLEIEEMSLTKCKWEIRDLKKKIARYHKMRDLSHAAHERLSKMWIDAGKKLKRMQQGEDWE